MDKKPNKLMMQMMAFLLLIVIMTSIFIILKSNDGNVTSSTPPKRFSNEYCSLLRPPDWTGTVKGNSFLFRKGKAVMLVKVDRFNQYNYTALDKNQKRFKNLLNEILDDQGIKLGQITDLTMQTGQFDSKFNSIKYRISTVDTAARGLFFYTNDVRLFYFSKWPKGNKRDEYNSGIFTDYILLKKELNTPLYERPIIDSGENIDTAKLMKEAESRIEQAIYIWGNSKKSSNDVLNAMKAFEASMKLIAKSGMGDFLDNKSGKIIDIYKECRKARKASINKMKSQIFQAKHLGNTKMAKELAEELVTMASLDSEAEVRQWAKNQIKMIK